jgi:hypothetical protein
MPPSLSTEELDLLLALAAPIDHQQGPGSWRRSRRSSRRRPSKPASGQALARCIGRCARCNGDFLTRRRCRTRARWRAPKGRSSKAGTLWATPRLSLVERPGFFASASVGAITSPRKLDERGGMQLGASSVPATLCSKRPDASQGPGRHPDRF